MRGYAWFLNVSLFLYDHVQFELVNKITMGWVDFDMQIRPLKNDLIN